MGPTVVVTARSASSGTGAGSTVKVAVPVPVLPDESVAVQLTRVLPTGKREPGPDRS
ncbi:hypothetical protein SSPO_012860 [Streptomyces antimycoticus]|uniref:Uncharacterized protein n=1 Tax=Streptomyces antimycoticus TaxID=68175 RepID=A0A499UGJ9_9ACTN|nr:hypothetical protein SSPO_012860 [Streptomyces antimycoticus]